MLPPPRLLSIKLSKTRIKRGIMSEELRAPHPSVLSSVIENCVSKLRAVSLALDTYGNEDHAAVLHEVIAQLQRVFPARSGLVPDSMDFIVNATFKVSRDRSLTCFRAPLAAKIAGLESLNLSSRIPSDFAPLST